MSEVNQVLHGDCLDVLKTLEANSVDALVCDPPAGISFMGKTWDTPDYFPVQFGGQPKGTSEHAAHKNPGGFAKGINFDSSKRARETFIAFMTEVMTEALRVLKPGAHGLVWALPRTSHWTAMALEDAGFEVRDKVFHLFGSGFPKSHNVSVAIDKLQGVEREVIGRSPNWRPAKTKGGAGFDKSVGEGPTEINITAPATPDGQKWSGFGSALKPACEEWILVRKPLAEKSIAAQVLATGTGALNIDASRVGSGEPMVRPNGKIEAEGWGLHNRTESWSNPQGKRFPSHLLLSHSLLCVPLGEKRVKANGPACKTGSTSTKNAYGEYSQRSTVVHRDDEGMETVEAWQCAEQCPVRLLDEQSGVRKSAGNYPSEAKGLGIFGERTQGPLYADQGGASRYFQTFPPFIYAAKSSRKERNAGCEALPEHAPAFGNTKGDGLGRGISNTRQDLPMSNHHPTVKSQQLMQYLCKMITPPNGVVLDMFAGSGSTGVACVQSGFRYILIEKEQEYVDIIHARLAHAHKAMPVQEAAEYECVPECPVRILGEMSGVSKSPKPYERGTIASNRNGIYGKKDKPVGYTDPNYGDTGKADRFFKVFPPGSLFEGMDEVSGEQESGHDGEMVT